MELDEDKYVESFTPNLMVPLSVQECGLELDEDKYIESFTPNLMVPLFRWAKGASFAEVAKGTQIFEGTLIRCTRRLMELMAQVRCFLVDSRPVLSPVGTVAPVQVGKRSTLAHRQ